MGCFCKVWNLVWLMNRISEEYLFNELSSLRSQLECWNNGMLEYWALGKWGSVLLSKSLFERKTRRFANELLPY